MAQIPTGKTLATNNTAQTTPPVSGSVPSVPEIVLAQIANAMPGHANASTVTPPVAPLTCDQIIALLPDRPERKKLAFGPLEHKLSEDGTALEFEFTLEGWERTDLLTTNVWAFFHRQLRSIPDGAPAFSNPEIRSGKNGVVIAFRGAVTPRETDLETMCDTVRRRACRVFDLALTVFLNLQDLGLLNDVHGLHNDIYMHQGLFRGSWRCSPGDESTFKQSFCISRLLQVQYYEAAYMMLADVLSVDKQNANFKPFLLHKAVDRNASGCLQNSDYEQLDHFVGLLCLDKRVGKSKEFAVAIGRIVLRELLSSHDNASALKVHHVILFERLAERRRRCWPSVARDLLRELLDLSDADRASLFRSPKARKLLLIAFPELRAVFEQIERQDYQVFCDRRQKLKDDHGFHFSCDVMIDEPMNITCDGLLDSAAVDRLLDLAEAAAMCAGLIGWATGALRFLSDPSVRSVLDEDRRARLKALRNRIQMAVRFDPDPQVAVTFGAVKKLTDDAMAEFA
jgi:hypothetical protein